MTRSATPARRCSMAAAPKRYPHRAAVSIVELGKAIDAGQVELLVIMGGNPVFTAPVDLRFADRLTKVPLVVYHSTHADETSPLCHWNVAETHPLESWGDSRSFEGTVTLTQPLIDPLYEGRSAHDFLAAFTSQPGRRGLAIVKDFWTKTYSSGAGGWAFKNPRGESFPNADAFWRAALHDGFIPGTSLTEGAPATTLTAASAAAPATAATAQPPRQRPPPLPQSSRLHRLRARLRAARAAPAAAGGLEIIFRPDPAIWDGRFANNGWLQELPKPYTKITWDPAAWISTRLAEERGLREGDVVELKYRGNTVRMPVFVVPGHPAQSVTVFFGYGRSRAGRVGNAVGASQQFNAFLLRTSDAPWFGSGLELVKTGDNYPLATTQEHHSMEGRAPVRTASLEEYTKTPQIIHEQGGHMPPRTLTLYPEHEYNGYKWGMAIDLTSCTGCSACVVACQCREQHPGHRQGPGAAQPRDALDPHRPLLRRRSRESASRSTSPCRACSARTRRARWSARWRRRRTARKA